MAEEEKQSAENIVAPEESTEAEKSPEAMPEKEKTAEEKKPEEKKQEKGQNRFLVYSAIISVIAIAIIAIGAWYLMSPAQDAMPLSITDFEHADTEKMHIAKVIVLISDECEQCEYDNSFIRMLTLNGIRFAAEEIDVKSEEGQKIASWLGAKKIPIVLLDATTIDDTMAVKTASGYFTLEDVLGDYLRIEQIAKADDIYVIPEINLDNAPHVEMFLDKNYCGTEDKVVVDLYTDPYCAPCALASLKVNSAVEKFGDAMDFNYNFYPLDSKKMLYTWEKISPFANYSICAARQGKLEAFQSSAYAYYCNSEQGTYDQNSLQVCIESPNYRIPMPIDELLEAISAAELDITELGNCLEQIEKDKPKMIETAEDYWIFEVPKVVVDCKYITHAEDIERAVCKARPDLEACN